ncbi:SirB family protein [Zoogloea oryzae]|uniref:SirB family protein n=1 Tax=Zoogloea oryzae TaxID=310767 RepID=A0ABQ6FHX9_9RHOO|nr:SirB2 family protein [Zoogloea oryzae]GLT24559.1 SirB family protein [Zoogloea oryzae]
MYLLIKHLHITCVVLSGAGFLLRGWWSITGSPLLKARLTRRLPHVIDSCLLASAIALAWMAGQYPFVDGWLTAKVLGLLAYIGLGVVALRPTRPLGVRVVALAAAAAVFSYIVSVALTKNPAGWLALV